MGQYFLGGQLQHLPAVTTFLAPCVNSYKRLDAGGFSPSNCTWGYDNRSVALRVPETRTSSARIEHRVAGADANPYLVIAACLASGYLGLRDKTTPPDPVLTDARTVSTAPLLPRSPGESVAALRDDLAVADLLGGDLVRLITAARLAEADRYSRVVTNWERHRYVTTL